MNLLFGKQLSDGRAFPHPKSRKHDHGKIDKPEIRQILQRLRGRAINVTGKRKGKDDVGPAKDRTFGGVFHDSQLVASAMRCLAFVSSVSSLHRRLRLRFAGGMQRADFARLNRQNSSIAPLKFRMREGLGLMMAASRPTSSGFGELCSRLSNGFNLVFMATRCFFGTPSFNPNSSASASGVFRELA